MIEGVCFWRKDGGGSHDIFALGTKVPVTRVSSCVCSQGDGGDVAAAAGEGAVRKQRRHWGGTQFLCRWRSHRSWARCGRADGLVALFSCRPHRHSSRQPTSTYDAINRLQRRYVSSCFVEKKDYHLYSDPVLLIWHPLRTESGYFFIQNVNWWKSIKKLLIFKDQKS